MASSVPSLAAVSVIIVNWNSGEHLGNCLAHLARQSVQPAKIFVVDNASADGSVDGLVEKTGLIKLSMGTNLGFAEGNNSALRQCTTEYVALLNPDAFPEFDWLERLLEAATLQPDIAAFGSQQLCANRPELLDGMGDSYHISGLVWRKGYGQQLSAVNLTPSEIFSPCAAAALYRCGVLMEVGGFDTDYFCYVEDVDLGFRLRLAGYKAMFVPDAVVKHVGSATTGGQHSDFAVYHGHRNLVWTYVKNMPGFLFWLFLPLHLLLNIVTLVLFSTRGQARVISRAKWDALKGLPMMWKKRKVIQSKRVASYRDIYAAMDKRILPGTRRL